MAHILLIDSDPGIQRIITQILEPLGHTLAVAEDGGQGIEICRRETVDLVVSDIRLTDMEAEEILANITALRPGLPVMIMAGIGDIETARGLQGRGAANYITKPFRVNDLTQMVQQTLRKSVRPREAPAETAAPPSDATVAPAAEAPAAHDAGKKIRLPFFVAGAVLLAALAAAGVYFGILPPKKEAVAAYAMPEGNPSGIAWDGAFVWVTDWVEGTITAHERNAAFSKVKEYVVKGIEPAGVAFQGKQIWISHGIGHKIYRYAAGDELTGGVSFDSPGPGPSGLFFDGIFLWVLDYQQGRIYKVSPATLAVISSYDSPAANPCSIFIRGKDAYVADAGTNRIFKVSPDNFVIRAVYALPGQTGVNDHLSAAACDGKDLWFCYDTTPKMFRCRLNDLIKIKS